MLLEVRSRQGRIGQSVAEVALHRREPGVVVQPAGVRVEHAVDQPHEGAGELVSASRAAPDRLPCRPEGGGEQQPGRRADRNREHRRSQPQQFGVGNACAGDGQPPDLGVLRPAAVGHGEVVEGDPVGGHVQFVAAHPAPDRSLDVPLDRHDVGLAGGEPAGFTPEGARVEPHAAEQQVVDPVGARGRVEAHLRAERACVVEVPCERPPGLGDVVVADLSPVEQDRWRHRGGTGGRLDRIRHHAGHARRHRGHRRPSHAVVAPPGLSALEAEHRSGGRPAGKSAANRKAARRRPGRLCRSPALRCLSPGCCGCSGRGCRGRRAS